MTATTLPATTSALDTLFAAVAAGDTSALVPLADALLDAGREYEHALLTGEIYGVAYVVPGLGVVATQIAFPRDAKRQRNYLSVTLSHPAVIRREDGRVTLSYCEESGYLRADLAGRPMHWRAAATRAAFDRAVRGEWTRIGTASGTHANPIYAIDAAEYGLTAG